MTALGVGDHVQLAGLNATGYVAYSPARSHPGHVEVFVGSRERYESVIEDGSLAECLLWVCEPNDVVLLRSAATLSTLPPLPFKDGDEFTVSSAVRPEERWLTVDTSFDHPFDNSIDALPADCVAVTAHQGAKTVNVIVSRTQLLAALGVVIEDGVTSD